MGFKIGDIVDARGGMGWHWPGPWVITHIWTKSNGIKGYLGYHLNGEEVRNHPYLEDQIEYHKATKQQKSIAKFLVMMLG